jgi:hypothetical protein
MQTRLIRGKKFPYASVLNSVRMRFENQFGYLHGNMFAVFTVDKSKPSTNALIDDDIDFTVYRPSQVELYEHNNRQYVVAKLGRNCTQTNAVAKSATSCTRKVCNNTKRQAITVY